VLLGVACTSPSAQRRVSGTAAQAQTRAEEDPPSEAPRLVASLERGACLGACPVYKVEAFDDGTVRFVGVRFVGHPGVSSGQLSPAQLADLRAVFARFDFDELKSYENTQTSDMPWVTLSNGRKTVRHYLGDERAPASLTALEKELDQLMHTARWLADPDR
jgi:hypothetical protein